MGNKPNYGAALRVLGSGLEDIAAHKREEQLMKLVREQKLADMKAEKAAAEETWRLHNPEMTIPAGTDTWGMTAPGGMAGAELPSGPQSTAEPFTTRNYSQYADMMDRIDPLNRQYKEAQIAASMALAEDRMRLPAPARDPVADALAIARGKAKIEQEFPDPSTKPTKFDFRKYLEEAAGGLHDTSKSYLSKDGNSQQTFDDTVDTDWEVLVATGRVEDAVAAARSAAGSAPPGTDPYAIVDATLRSYIPTLTPEREQQLYAMLGIDSSGMVPGEAKPWWPDKKAIALAVAMEPGGIVDVALTKAAKDGKITDAELAALAKKGGWSRSDLDMAIAKRRAAGMVLNQGGPSETPEQRTIRMLSQGGGS